MGKPKKEVDYFVNKAKNLLYSKSEDIQYKRRNKHNFQDSRDLVGNNKIAQKALREYYGLKK